MARFSSLAGLAVLATLTLGAGCTSTGPAAETAASDPAKPAPAAKAASGESALATVGFCDQTSNFGGCQKKRQTPGKKLSFDTPSSSTTAQPKPREQDLMDVQP